MCASATQFATLFQLIVLLESHQERANNYLVCTNDIVHSFQNKLRSSTHKDRGYTHGTRTKLKTTTTIRRGNIYVRKRICDFSLEHIRVHAFTYEKNERKSIQPTLYTQ